MHRHAEAISAGSLARYAAMAGKAPVEVTRVVVVMNAATQGHLAAVIQLCLRVVTRQQLVAAMGAARRDIFAVRIKRGVVWKERSVALELVCPFSLI
jgi:hypothetical protein